MRLLVFVGPKQSGKDASARILKENKTVTGNISFALPLKRICSNAFNVSMALFNDDVLKDRPFAVPIEVTIRQLRKVKDALADYVDPNVNYYNLAKVPSNGFVDLCFRTPREILQVIGTEFIRNNIFIDYHVHAAFSTHNIKLGQFSVNSPYAITDCRFLSEYEYLSKNHDCQFFYVERPEAEVVLDGATHQSELEVRKVRDVLLANGGTLIKNDGSLKDLAEKLKNIKVAPATHQVAIKQGKFISKKAREALNV